MKSPSHLVCLISCASRERESIAHLVAEEIGLLLGPADRSAFPGEHFYEKLETPSFTEPSALQFVARSNAHLADRFVWIGAREGFCRSGGAEKSRTTDRAQSPSSSAKSAPASALSSGNAKGRRSAQSPERRGLCGVLDSRGGGRSFVRGDRQARSCETASGDKWRSGTTGMWRRQSSRS